MSVEGDLARAGIIVGDDGLVFTKDAEIIGDLSVSGESIIAGNVTVSGNLYVGGTITGPLTGSLYVLTIQNFITSSAGDVYTVVPSDGAGKITRIRAVILTAVTTADATLTITVEGSSASDQTVTLPYSGSTTGDVITQDFAATATNTTVAAGEYIKVSSDGGGDTGAVSLFIEITRS